MYAAEFFSVIVLVTNTLSDTVVILTNAMIRAIFLVTRIGFTFHVVRFITGIAPTTCGTETIDAETVSGAILLIAHVDYTDLSARLITLVTKTQRSAFKFRTSTVVRTDNFVT
jgi:hypothetical protein